MTSAALTYLVAFLATLTHADTCLKFTIINALLCIRSEFVETYPFINSSLDCSLRCYQKQRCRAFSIADELCKLYVFDKCSKGVRDCSCSRVGQVYVRHQPGLPEGALCPIGYGDDLCGTKYKYFSGINSFTVAKTAIEGDPGLVIMADVTDSSELTHIKSLFTKYSWTQTILLGGYQMPGSPEPAGGWSWISCSINISSSLWSPNEPNNSENVNENVVVLSLNLLLGDGTTVYSGYGGALAECLNPFN